MNRGDLLGAVSYALRREVTIHSIISGSAYSALHRFIHLLESVSSTEYLIILSRGGGGIILSLAVNRKSNVPTKSILP